MVDFSKGIGKNGSYQLSSSSPWRVDCLLISGNKKYDAFSINYAIMFAYCHGPTNIWSRRIMPHPLVAHQ